MKPFAPSFQLSHTLDNTSSSLRSIPNWVRWNEVKAGHFSLRWKQSSCRWTRTGRPEGTKPPSLLCAYRHTPTFSTEAFPKAKWTSSLIKGTSRLPKRPKPRLPFPQSFSCFSSLQTSPVSSLLPLTQSTSRNQLHLFTLSLQILEFPSLYIKIFILNDTFLLIKTPFSIKHVYT